MSHEIFESVVNNIFFWVSWFFELVGALIIVYGAIIGIHRSIRGLIKHKKEPIKTLLANHLTLGLEFMIVSEILKTVITTNRILNEIFMLAAIVILRGAISILLHWELKLEEKREEVTEKRTRKLENKSKNNA